MSEWPRQIDVHLVPRVSVKIAARYIGRSPRWIQREIVEGRLRAIDTSRPGSRRPCWSVSLADLRALVIQYEIRAERRLAAAEAKACAEEATEPKNCDTCDTRRPKPSPDA